MAKYYRIGVLTNPLPDDIGFESLEVAYDEAQKRAIKSPNTPIAIWDDGDEVERLFLYGSEFREI